MSDVSDVPAGSAVKVTYVEESRTVNRETDGGVYNYITSRTVVRMDTYDQGSGSNG